MTDTYQIDSLDDLAPFLTALLVTEVAGRTFATVQAGRTITELAIGEPLCMGCDAAVADGPCGCEG